MTLLHPPHEFANMDYLNRLTYLLARVQEIDVAEAPVDKVVDSNHQGSRQH